MTDLRLLIRFLRKNKETKNTKKASKLTIEVVPLVLMRKNIGDAQTEIFFPSVHTQDSRTVQNESFYEEKFLYTVKK